MNIKLLTGISLSLFLFCTTVFAEPLQVSTVYTDRPDEVSFTITLPPGLETPPKPSDFQLLDGTRVIKSADMIERFSESNRKIALLFCVDVSGSITKALFKEAQVALINTLSGDLPRDKYRFALVSFADKVVIPQDFTDNPDALIISIRGLQRSSGDKTLLYQAIIDSLNKLKELKPAESRRIVIITDGRDVGGIETPLAAINLAKSLGIPLDIIGLGIVQKTPTTILMGLAAATGGHYICPKCEASSSKEASLRLKDAVNRLNKRFMEDAWIVYFKYKPDAEKPKLENAVIKFKTNFSATISEGIPAPNVTTEPPFVTAEPPPVTAEPPPVTAEPPPVTAEHTSIDMDKLKKLSIYIGLPLLVLATLVFIFWLLRRHNGSSTIISVIPVTEPPKQPYTDEIPQPTENKRRLTEVASVINASHLHQDKPRILLEVTEGPLEGHKIPMDKQLFRIGSKQDNDLVLVDDYVSGNHALLYFENGKLLLSDLHSRNGTLLNGGLVGDKTPVVFPGDVIRLGNSSLKVTEL
jgi:Mg-chelatase subunit ChlD